MDLASDRIAPSAAISPAVPFFSDSWLKKGCLSSGVTGNIFGGGSTNSVEDRGQREGDLGAVDP